MHVTLFSVLLIIQFLLITSVSASESRTILKITGWDVYADPINNHKTIGYKSFEEKNNVTIQFFPLNNLDDIISAAESGEDYDVFIISNEGIRLLHDMNLVSALDLNQLPNYQNLHHDLQYSEWSQFDSQVFAVPWAWGPTGLMYNTDIIKSPDSWNILWDHRYQGKVAMWDDVSMIWTTALALGYQNVYSLTRKQLQAVKLKLLAFNDQAALYYRGGNEELELARQGKLVAYNSWYDPSERLIKSGRNFRMIIPKEGAVGMFDSYMLSNSSEQSELVHRYINHQISPQIQEQMVHITGLAPANIATLELLEPALIKKLHLDEQDYFNRMLLWDHMPRKNLYEEVLEAVRQDFKQKHMGK